MLKIGFIGFGEAAFHIAAGLRADGLDGIYAYDKFWNILPQSSLVNTRAKEAGVILAPSLRGLIESVDIVISSVSANLAISLAEESAPYLKSGQLYVDLNSAGPETKIEADQIISPIALFVDVAVMGPVPGNRHKVPMLASGTGAKAFAAQLAPYGMKITVLDGAAGKASASKMFRSIFMKGFVVLLLETVIAGHTYGIEDDVLKSIEETLTTGNFQQIINGLLSRGAVHSERREHEMDEVVATLRSLGVESTMAEATKKKLAWCTRQGLKEYFKGAAPTDFHEIFAALEMDKV